VALIQIIRLYNNAQMDFLSLSVGVQEITDMMNCAVYVIAVNNTIYFTVTYTFKYIVTCQDFGSVAIVP
jgi:hypothetical protein